MYKRRYQTNVAHSSKTWIYTWKGDYRELSIFRPRLRSNLLSQIYISLSSLKVWNENDTYCVRLTTGASSSPGRLMRNVRSSQRMWASRQPKQYLRLKKSSQYTKPENRTQYFQVNPKTYRWFSVNLGPTAISFSNSWTFIVWGRPG